MPLSGNFRREMLKALKDAKKAPSTEGNSESSSNNMEDQGNDDNQPPPRAPSVVIKNPVNVSTQTPDLTPSKEDVRK